MPMFFQVPADILYRNVFTALLLCVVATTTIAETIHGKVVGVSDGDTITVLDSDYQQYKVRLAGIDAPEKSQAFGNRSKERLSDLVFSKSVCKECPMELSNLSLVELKNLLTLIPAEIKKREKEDKAKTLKELEALAAERGFNLADLLGEGSTKVKKERGTVAVKYRHPQNADLAWRGRDVPPFSVAESFRVRG